MAKQLVVPTWTVDRRMYACCSSMDDSLGTELRVCSAALALAGIDVHWDTSWIDRLGRLVCRSGNVLRFYHLRHNGSDSRIDTNMSAEISSPFAVTEKKWLRKWSVVVHNWETPASERCSRDIEREFHSWSDVEIIDCEQCTVDWVIDTVREEVCRGESRRTTWQWPVSAESNGNSPDIDYLDWRSSTSSAMCPPSESVAADSMRSSTTRCSMNAPACCGTARACCRYCGREIDSPHWRRTWVCSSDECTVSTREWSEWLARRWQWERHRWSDSSRPAVRSGTCVTRPLSLLSHRSVVIRCSRSHPPAKRSDRIWWSKTEADWSGLPRPRWNNLFESDDGFADEWGCPASNVGHQLGSSDARLRLIRIPVPRALILAEGMEVGSLEGATEAWIFLLMELSRWSDPFSRETRICICTLTERRQRISRSSIDKTDSSLKSGRKSTLSRSYFYILVEDSLFLLIAEGRIGTSNVIHGEHWIEEKFYISVLMYFNRWVSEQMFSGSIKKSRLSIIARSVSLALLKRRDRIQ